MKTLLQYGAGNIGRGFIGQLFSLAGYRVVFIDVNKNLVGALNHKRRYPVTIVEDNARRDIWVENVSAIDGNDQNAVIKEIENADIMATAVGVNILPVIGGVIAKGISSRFAGGRGPLDILICENMMGADKYLHRLIYAGLNDEEKKYFDENIGLVETSIGRMVPVMTARQLAENPLGICAERFSQLPVDKDAFKGEIPAVPELLPYSPFGFYLKRKLFIHNMGHALTAYLGHIAGYETVWQAIGDSTVKTIVKNAMRESARSLSLEFNYDLSLLKEHIDDLIARFANKALGDTVQRVGNDVKRKLSPGDRFTGALENCRIQGLPAKYIPMGIAAALFFDSAQDRSSKSLFLDLREKGPAYVITRYAGINPGEEGYGLILDYYDLLKKEKDIGVLLGKI